VLAGAAEDFSIPPQAAESYYPTAVKEFKNGYLYYSMALPNGSRKTVTLPSSPSGSGSELARIR